MFPLNLPIPGPNHLLSSPSPTVQPSHNQAIPTLLQFFSTICMGLPALACLHGSVHRTRRFGFTALEQALQLSMLEQEFCQRAAVHS